jgi:radical SAM protein with 4Fe4S-binding SPASM domain
MACKYCYLGCKENADKTERKVVDVKFAKRAIQDYFQHQARPAVRFFADGEPTLEMKLIKELYEYAEGLTNNIAFFELQTNGSFDDDSARWIRDHMDIVYISSDGCPSEHDFQRVNKNGKGTSSVIEKNIRILAENPKLQLGCRATITKYNVFKQKEMIDYFHALGVKILFSDKVFAPIGGSAGQFNIDNKVFVDEFVEARAYAEKKYGDDFFYGSMYSANFDEEVIYACRSCTATPHVTPDGYISCCDLCVSGDNPTMRELIYGVYDSNLDKIFYDENAIVHIKSRKAENIMQCHNCEVRNYCAGACLGEALNETGDFYGVKEEACEAIRYLWQKLGGQPIKNKYLHP